MRGCVWKVKRKKVREGRRRKRLEKEGRTEDAHNTHRNTHEIVAL